MKVVLGIEKWN